MVDLNQTAPDFTLPRDGGQDITLSAQRPQAVVLYFYPKDDTKGCTLEAIDFTASKDEFDQCNTVVIGVSKDSVESHEKFCNKHNLSVPLVSDVDGAVCEAYGVWVEKNNYGKKYMGIERTTFLIDGEGKIAKIWNKVRVKDHVADVLAAAQDL